MTMKRKKYVVALTVCAVILLLIAIWIIWSNTALELNTYRLVCDDLPESFDGFRIAHISDLHNNEMGRNHEELLSMLREAKPDIIAITGDLIDSRKTDFALALSFVKEAVTIAPCYYVTGNHEARISDFDLLKSGLIECGVIVLENEKIEIDRSVDSVTLIGVNDQSFETNYLLGNSVDVMQNNLQKLTEENCYTILLSHRPELMDVYANKGVDLVLSGHAHGGQFRLPFCGGIFAPNQGFFPKYDAGLFEQDNTTMIVSRGIGNSIFPVRFNNRPEVILIILESE